MNFQKRQSFLAQLYTNSILRENFFQNPQRISQEYALDSVFCQELLSQEVAIRFFAQSLLNKRLHILKQLLPKISPILPNLKEIFEKYAQKPLPAASQKYVLDAYLFCEFILKNCSLTKQEHELVSFEKLLKKISLSKQLFFVRLFDYTVQKNKLEKQKSYWFFLKIGHRVVFEKWF